MYCTRVLALIVLLVGLVHSFSWDIVVATHTRLEFYNNDGTLTHTQIIPSAHWIASVTYDPVHYRVLLADYHNFTTFIFSLDVSTKTVQRLVTTATEHDVRIVYDPVTQTLYWKEGHNIHSFSLNPASFNQADGNLLVTLDNGCCDLAVDSCGGYIYWITDYEVERARLDGSEREVLIQDTVSSRLSLAIDQQTRKMYWIERRNNSADYVSIESANFNGKNRTTLYIVRNTRYAFSLAVSKDFIYWQNYYEQDIWQLPKYSSQTVATKLHTTANSDCWGCHRIAANYKIKDLIQGINSCDALQGLIPNDSKSECTAPVCQNYCIQGECSVSAEGQPTCSCIAGYFGERCEVSICKDYCFQGNCSVGAQGQPKCSCMTGYSGKRCEENACHKHCLNGGVCTLNKEDEPACQCAAGYDGGRCELFAYKDNSSCEGTISACYQFCLNDGACYLNDANEPVCQCTADHEGDRCEFPVNKDFSFQFVASVIKGQPKLTFTVSEGVESTCASTVVGTTELV